MDGKHLRPDVLRIYIASIRGRNYVEGERDHWQTLTRFPDGEFQYHTLERDRLMIGKTLVHCQNAPESQAIIPVADVIPDT